MVHRSNGVLGRAALALVLVSVAAGGALAGTGKIQWREGRSHDAALAEAKASGVPVMVFFSSDGCGACQSLCSSALSDDEVVKASEKLIRVHVDAGRDSKLFDKYAVKQMPTLIFLDPEGKEVGRLGGRDASSVKRQFEEIAEKYTRGPAWSADADAALASGKADGKPVVLVFVDGKAKSETLLKSFGDAAYGSAFEGFLFAKVAFKKDSEECRKWGVTEAPSMVVVDARGEDAKAVRTIKGLKAPKDLRKDLEELVRKFEKN